MAHLGSESLARPSIAVQTRERCPLCGSPGPAEYFGLSDFLYDVPGEWSFRRCERTNCHALWLDPTPTPEDIGKAYETYYTHDSAERPAGRGSGRNGPIAQLLRRGRDAHLARRFGYGGPDAGGRSGRLVAHALAAFPGGRDFADDMACFMPAPGTGDAFLEIGFGNGTQLRRMRRLGWQVTGVEQDPSSAESARAQGFRVLLGDLSEHHLPDDSIDAVYGSHCIEHVHEPLQTLQECRRILRPGGNLVMVTPNADSWGRRRYGKSWLGLDAPRHLTVFTPSSLADIARRAGFEDVSVRTTSRGAALIVGCSSSIRRNGKLPQQRPLRAGDWLMGLLSQVVESSLLTARRNCGEELILVAR
jgi:SAM-dependent methyltransferase